MKNTSLDNGINIEILFEDKDITVCIKPVGILSEDSANGEKGLVGLLSDRADKNLYLLHRLDRDVGGVMVFANNKKSASVLSEAIRNNELKKEYLTVLDGIPDEKSGVLKDLLFKDSRKNHSYVVDRVRKGVREASLEYKVLAEKDGKSVVRVLLHTGRTHQIRVQFSSRKMPLTGDVKYGSKDRNGKSIALHSCSITFRHPSTGETMSFGSTPDCQGYPWCLFGGLGND